jgi:hypothetical protein
MDMTSVGSSIVMLCHNTVDGNAASSGRQQLISACKVFDMAVLLLQGCGASARLSVRLQQQGSLTKLHW